MIGRALRGKEAGGGAEANIVMFMDEWKRLIDWATPSALGGDTEEGPTVRGHYPLEHISIRLVEELVRHINSGGQIPLSPFARITPIGWYQTECVISESETEETQSFSEFVMVYEQTEAKFDSFIEEFIRKVPAGWDREYIPEEFLRPQVDAWIAKYFDKTEDDFGSSLELDLVRFARHLAQKMVVPQFFPFKERKQFDLDTLAHGLMNRSIRESDQRLRNEFVKPGNLWKVFYKSYERFFMAYSGAVQRILMGGDPPTAKIVNVPKTSRRPRELSDAEKRQVKLRDKNSCLCCGVSGKGVRLEIDHIVSYNIGGETSIENSQTLCSVCNRTKGINDLNYLQTATLLREPKEIEFLPREGREDVRRTVMRIVNLFYHCKAVCQLRIHERRSGRHYSDWEIELFAGNDPKWLNQYKKQFLKHIQENLQYDHVTSIKVMSSK
jgi:hypothetical protein